MLKIAKKTIVLALATSLISLAAHAELITHNNTTKYSTVNVAGFGCAAKLGKYTAPGRTLSVSDFEVKLICRGQNPCSATIIMSDEESDVKNCIGTKAGEATLNTSNLEITSLIPSSTYKLSGEHTNTLTISE